KRMEKQHKAKDINAVWNFSNEKYGTYIYVDKKKKATLCYVVSFFADNEKGNPSRPLFIMDVKSGKVIDSFNTLTNAVGTGPGGNGKVGLYEYGADYPGFCVTQEGTACTMDCTNVKTVDLNHGTSGSTAFSYTCPRNTHEPINGGYCPMNDAQYFGQVVFDTYMDWYGVPVLPFKLILKCHYSTNYENAFWDGTAIYFGDGSFGMYPPVGLDVVGHEASHGFTQNHSGLIYSGQSGGIHESFSDMAGEAVKFYMRSANDFRVGYDILKSPTGAVRYMYDPPLDGVSIDHVGEYFEGLDVHYSSGIFNKAFYLIATSSGWSTRMAFDIFTKANMDYWTSGANFQQGALGALEAAVDYGYPCADVVNAFAAVGISLSCPAPPVANFTASPTTGTIPFTVYFTDISTNNPTSWSWTFEGGSPAVSSAKNPVVTYNTAGTFDVTLVAASAPGSDTETKTDYIIGCTPSYCASQGNNQTIEWIARVKVGSLNNSSGASPYSDFTSLTADLPSPGGLVSFELVPGFSGSAYTEYWRIWIDYNRDSDFTETNDLVYSGSGTTMRSGSFTVAAAAIKGITRMRVAMKWGSAPTSCETFSYGEVEDYTADIGGADVGYCASSGNSQVFEWIGRVQIGTLDNSSGASPYSDYTSIITNMTRGADLNITLTPAFSGAAYTEYWKIWIDYNKDGDFVDAGENIFSTTGNTVVSGSFTVSSSALRGYTGMRVTMKFGSAPTSCGTFTYGEVEDYTANIL
ncbi:MAG: M4 family metallopeptidase, partial [Candidatus Aminicenantes bacterium]|nr:M4 family metallopeptidase [Candidatus Aminicenantes bacterium]